MIAFQIRIVDKIVRINSIYPSLRDYCQNYIVTDNTSVSPDLVISIDEEDIAEEISSSDVINSCINKEIDTQYLSYLESVVAYRKIVEALLSYDVLLLHGSIVATDGAGYMFTAPSGVGKTMRTRLWLDLLPSSIVVNGDKPLIKIADDKAIACGTPWCGKEGMNTNAMVPLRAIFLLERADGDKESEIEEIGLDEAFPFLLQQAHRPEDPELLRRTLTLLKFLAGKVKLYRFRSAPTRESVRLAYETARPR